MPPPVATPAVTPTSSGGLLTIVTPRSPTPSSEFSERQRVPTKRKQVKQDQLEDEFMDYLDRKEKRMADEVAADRVKAEVECKKFDFEREKLQLEKLKMDMDMKKLEAELKDREQERQTRAEMHKAQLLFFAEITKRFANGGGAPPN
jgi:hypothetical protein